MIRICLANGAWPILTLAAALEQQAHEDPAHEGEVTTVLVLYEADGNSEHRDWMVSFAALFPVWERTVWADEVFGLAPSEEVWPLPLAAEGQKLKRILGVDHAHEVWLTHFHSYPERLLLETYSGADLVLYEEGLNSYISLPRQSRRPGDLTTLLQVAPRLLLKGRLRAHLASLRISDWRTPGSYVRRVTGMYLCLKAIYPELQQCYAKPFRLVDCAVFRDVIGSAARCSEVRALASPVAPAVERRALLLSQSLYRERQMKRREEVNQLAVVVQDLADLGYVTCFKEHPRETDPLFPELRDACGDCVEECQVPAALPIEVVAQNTGFACYIGAYTSSLFYLGGIWGMPVYTMARRFIPTLDPGPMRSCLELAERHLPSMDRIAGEQ